MFKYSDDQIQEFWQEFFEGVIEEPGLVLVRPADLDDVMDSWYADKEGESDESQEPA